MKTIYLLIAAIIFLGGLHSCKKHADDGAARSFYMGVTPWPADFTEQESGNAYNFINNHCDIISNHFDDGIRSEEAYENKPMPASLQ